MGRPRLNRRVVTYSLADDTLKRLTLLRDHEQNRLQQRRTRVTLSEIIDDAVRLLDRQTFMDDDPTHGGRFFVPWLGTEKWECPYCREAGVTDNEAGALAGGWIVCPYVKCKKPRPTTSYPEPLPDGWKIQEACVACGTDAKVVQVEAGLRDY